MNAVGVCCIIISVLLLSVIVLLACLIKACCKYVEALKKSETRIVILHEGEYREGQYPEHQA